MVECLNNTSLEPTNPNTIKVPNQKLMGQRKRQLGLKTLDTSVINSPMSPPSPPCRNKLPNDFQLHESYLGSNATNQRILGVTVSEQGADTQQYL